MLLTDRISHLEDCLDYRYQNKDTPKTLIEINGQIRQGWAYSGDKFLGTWLTLWLMDILSFEKAKDSEYKTLHTNKSLRGLAIHYDIPYIFDYTIIKRHQQEQNIGISQINTKQIGTIMEACFYSIYLDSGFEAGYEWIKMWYFENNKAREAALRSYNNKRVVSRKDLARELVR
ncbi:MAG: hypothetical protein J4451_02010 [DPANN group archaeon]|nr:hypothetical protein [DPANN group archaeon]